MRHFDSIPKACLLFLFLTGSLARADFQSTVNSIVEAVRPYLTTLPYSTDVYTYTTREKVGLPNLGFIQPKDPRFPAFIDAKSKIFWEIEKQIIPSSDTNGLYAAIDPVAAREYFGKDYWVLFRLRLPVGFDYLDLAALDLQGSSNKLFEPIRNQLSALGCDPDWARSFRHLLMKNISIECRTIALEVLKVLKVSSFLYDWTAVDFRDCQGRNRGAFVILDLTSIKVSAADSIQPFTAELDLSDPLNQERITIQALFQQVKSPANASPSQRFEIAEKFWSWPILNEAAKDLDLRDWLSEHLMYCQNIPKVKFDL